MNNVRISTESRELIHSHINALIATFGPIRRPAETNTLRALFKERNVNGLVREIRNSLGLKELRVVIKRGEAGARPSPNAVAWVARSQPMPPLGTPAFRGMTVELYYVEQILCSFATAVRVLTHELSHPLLDAHYHPLRESERAVDLAAMLHGYYPVFTAYAQDFDIETEAMRAFLGIPGWANMSPFASDSEVKFPGYLTRDEIRYAAGLMETWARHFAR